MKSVMRLLTAGALALLLAACGGGGGCAGTVNGTDTCASTSTPVPGSVPAVARFIYTLDKSSITNSGADSALLTIKAVDANNNSISGVSVTVALTSGSFTTTSNATDANGELKGTIDIGGDYSNRNITATFTDGNGAVGVATVVVKGAAISIQPVPATPAPGDTVVVTLKATNINGAAIQSASIQLSGMGYTGTLTTDATGSAQASITAPAAGSYNLTATGLGVTALQAVVVVGGGGGAVPSAVATVNAADLSINPNTIGPNTVGSTSSRATLKVVFKDVNNLPIQYVRVRFDIPVASGSAGEQISTGTSIVYSDANGVATADYIAGTSTSSTNGVGIRACYGNTDISMAGGACPAWKTSSLTVAGQAISIAIGSNNTLQSSNNGLTYVKTLVVTVNDAAGLAVAGAGVSASLDITHYAKGYSFNDPYYTFDGVGYTPQLLPPTINILNDANGLPLVGGAYTPPALPPGNGRRIWCLNEDYNRNGFLDSMVGTGASPAAYPSGTEDVNGTGIVEPRKAAITVSYVNGQTSTKADGTLLLNVQYSMDVATWLAYTVKVSTSVGGTEGKDEKAFVTDYLMSDEPNGSFHQPLHGYGRCVDNF